MANTSDLTAQAHLAAGMQKLEALRRKFLLYLACREQGVLIRAVVGQKEEATNQDFPNLTEWLS